MVRRRNATHRIAECPADRYARQSGCLRRLAGRGRRADDSVLRPLRRAAGRPVEPVALAAVRSDYPRRRDLRPRIGGRQRPGVHAPEGGGGAPQAEPSIAGQHQVHARRRRRGRQRTSRRFRAQPQVRVVRRRRGHFRFADVRAGCAVDLLRPARPRSTSRSIFAEVRPTFTPDRLVELSRTPHSCWRK